MEETTIRECTTVEEFDGCVALQREAFGLPDLELSPRRHLIVSRHAGGWTLGAFVADRLVGFVHHLAAVRGEEIFGYSHMMAVAAEFQNKGVGAQLKWGQRARALSEGRDFIKWTFEPVKARNAHFNLNRLGVVVRSYALNFYGTDYGEKPEEQAGDLPGMDSDRLFASWELNSPRVQALSERREVSVDSPDGVIEISNDFASLLKSNPAAAKAEALRIREEFLRAFAAGLVCRAFERDEKRPKYLLYREDQ